MGKRGGGGASKAKGAGAKGGQESEREKLDAGATPGKSPSDAADELGVPKPDKPHWVNGAEDVDNALRPGPDGKTPSPESVGKQLLIDIDVVIRKYGRRAGRAYHGGAYWALVKAMKTALALGAVAGVHVPGQGAVNAGMIGGYWAGRP